MGANTLHLKGDEALTAPVQTARFVCKAERVRELTDTLTHMTRQSPFHVVKVIELTEAGFAARVESPDVPALPLIASC